MRRRLLWKTYLSFLVALLVPLTLLHAQDNYEIQVYGSDLVPKGDTMVELHSNYTIDGSTTPVDGMYPTEGAVHETVEITHGFSDWFETGFYIFTAAPQNLGYQWVGDHIRPRVRIPEKWKWPVGVSLSMEIGYQRAQFSPDTWTLEVRPIVDKKLGPWYLAFNPTLDRSLHGLTENKGFEFSPNAKISYDVIKQVAVGLEYYGALGPITGFDPLREQEQQIVPAVDLNVSPKWEFNFGVGVGVTHGTDHLLVKWIVGRRFNGFFGLHR